MIDLDDMVAGYVQCLLWTLPHDDADDFTGVTAETLDTLRADCEAFLAIAGDDVDEYAELTGGCHGPADSFGRGHYSAAECLGHDLAYSRNGHGTGFWDRGEAPVFRRLTDAASAMGEIDLEVEQLIR